MDAYAHSRKSPRTRKAGPEFADPDCDLAADWYDAHQAVRVVVPRVGRLELPKNTLPTFAQLLAAPGQCS